MSNAALARFSAGYASHRAAEGRGYAGQDLLDLPYLRSGPFAQQWAVRARSFEAFVEHVLRPAASATARPLAVLDVDVGNGWLSYRVALEGHSAIALDIRNDAIDGLGAAEPFALRYPDRIDRIVASFDDIPLPDGSVDIAIFSAALHYAVDLAAVLAEAARVTRPGGHLIILDSPFYAREEHGLAMVAEKQAQATQRFGDRAGSLMAIPFIEFLTRERLAMASAAIGLSWQRRRVRYPLHYELRPLRAALRGGRRTSRFDLWPSRRP